MGRQRDAVASATNFAPDIGDPGKLHDTTAMSTAPVYAKNQLERSLRVTQMVAVRRVRRR